MLSFLGILLLGILYPVAFRYTFWTLVTLVVMIGQKAGGIF